MDYVKKYTQEEARSIDYQLDVLTECIQELELKIPKTIPIIKKYLDKIDSSKFVK